jgi:hypothetical protein
MFALRNLSLKFNRVERFEPLSSIMNLSYIWLDSGQVRDRAALEELLPKTHILLDYN